MRCRRRVGVLGGALVTVSCVSVSTRVEGVVDVEVLTVETVRDVVVVMVVDDVLTRGLVRLCGDRLARVVELLCVLECVDVSVVMLVTVCG